jgi:hypothetical protein
MYLNFFLSRFHSHEKTTSLKKRQVKKILISKIIKKEEAAKNDLNSFPSYFTIF